MKPTGQRSANTPQNIDVVCESVLWSTQCLIHNQAAADKLLQSFIAFEWNNFQHVQETWFQQDGATPHTAQQSLEAVEELFSNHVISRFGNISWHPRLPDLSVCDFFLWGYLKE